MIKGVLIGFGIMIVLALIPIVHIAGIPFGPFIGGYFGISAANDSRGSPGRKAMVFGAWTGLLMLVVFAISAGIVETSFDFERNIRIMMWASVWVFTLYFATMSGLGAWYSELKARG